MSQKTLRRLVGRLEAVREQERIRIARELHDEFGQMLALFEASLQLCRVMCSTGSLRNRKLLKQLDEMAGLLVIANDSVKTLCAELRPSVLDNLGVTAAIKWQARRFQELTGIRCRMYGLQRDLGLDANQSTTVFRIVQEILANAARHSHATTITFHMRVKPQWLELEIHDNGTGMEPEPSAVQSLGILGMQERARLLGGNVAIESGRKKGTTVTLRLPLGKPASAGNNKRKAS